jgi:hypothetical protein
LVSKELSERKERGQRKRRENRAPDTNPCFTGNVNHPIPSRRVVPYAQKRKEKGRKRKTKSFDKPSRCMGEMRRKAKKPIGNEDV